MGDGENFGRKNEEPLGGRDFALPALRLAPTSGQPSSLVFDGERFVPDYKDGSIELEHIHRYAFAAPYAVGKDVLDVACGEGYGSDLLAQVARSVVGIDIDQASVDHASARYVRDNLRFMAADAARLPLAKASVDVCVSFETIEHLHRQKDFLREIRRVLRPDGVLIISSPNREVYRKKRSDSNRFHVKELASVEFSATISDIFRFSYLYRQDIVFGSLIVPDLCVEDSVCKDAMISLDPETQDIEVVERGIAQCYLIIVASDVKIPLNGLSAYKGDYPDNPLSAMTGGIRERDAELLSLHGRIEGLEREKAAYQDGCNERDDAIAKLGERVADLLRERDAFRDGCTERDYAVVKLRERVADLMRERDSLKVARDALG